jgi:3-isopropylmalate/(R)-2-methylmalate dehydratase large subunit
MGTPRTLFEKVWSAHEVVPETPDTPAVLFIDLHLTHEVTTPQAFTVLRERGLKVRRPDLTIATMDHATPTRTEQVFGGAPISIESAAQQIRQLERNCADFGIELLGLQDSRRGIVHIIGPELGLTRPGSTIVCGDSHTSRRSACCRRSRAPARSRSRAGSARASPPRISSSPSSARSASRAARARCSSTAVRRSARCPWSSG